MLQSNRISIVERGPVFTCPLGWGGRRRCCARGRGQCSALSLPGARFAGGGDGARRRPRPNGALRITDNVRATTAVRVPSPGAALGDGDSAAHCPYLAPARRAVGTARCAVRAPTGRCEPVATSRPPHPYGFRRLTLRSATGTAQRTVPTWRPLCGRWGRRAATGTAQRTVPTKGQGAAFLLAKGGFWGLTGQVTN